MANRPRQILLKGDPIRKEGIATESITPGHLIDFVSGSAALAGNQSQSSKTMVAYLRKHSQAGGNASPKFAFEQDYIGSVPPGVAIDKVYHTNDEVFYGHGRPGDEILAWLAASNTVAFGDYLESNGDGTLRLAAATSAAASANERLIARSLEAVTSGVLQRLIVEVI